MSAAPEPSFSSLSRLTRTFILTVMVADAIALRPNRPHIRGPLTPLAQAIFRALMFCFQNAVTGLCNPSIATIAKTVGCAESSVKLLLAALFRTEYLTWKHGKRKRIRTRAGWRVVRSSNHYRILCPTRHLAELRRMLIKAAGGRNGPLIQAVVARFTPPSDEAKATAEIVEALAADLRPSEKRSAPNMDTDPSSQAPPAPAGSTEIGGVQVDDPTLGSVLERLWTALEKRERRKS